METKEETKKMVTFNIKKEIDIIKFTYEVFQNFPECAMCLQCTYFNYDKMIFRFYDYENNKEYELTSKKIEEGTVKFINYILEGKYPGLVRTPEDIFDESNWDGCVTDACMQTCIFGEAIYG
jgi:hypothetical protein